MREAALAAAGGAPWSVQVRGEIPSPALGPDGGGLAATPPVPAGDALGLFASPRVLELEPGGEFRDLVPVFTGLRLGPALEGLDTIADDAIGICCDHGGHIGGFFMEDKGPCLMAIFGAPRSHGNDMERACRFARELADLHPGMTRTAISAGRGYAGLLGSMQRCTYTALGDVVNTACRVMCRAEWGSVLLAGEEQNRWRRNLQLVPVGRMALKGKRVGVPVSRVEEAGAAPRREFRVAGPQRGRWSEIERMLSFAALAKGRREASVLLVTGGQGIGKTAALSRLERALGEGYSVFRCSGRGSFRGGWLLGPLFTELGAALSREELSDGMPVDFAPAGRDSIESVEEEQAAALMQALASRAGAAMPVLLLDDLHLADEPSLEVLARLASSDENRLLIVASTADDGELRGFPPSKARSLSVRLSPLGRRDAALLIRDVLGLAPSCGLLNRALELSAGNPLYLTEYCRYLQTEGCIDTRGSVVRLLPGAGSDLAGGIGSVVTARLDRLDDDLRQLVLAASVLGTEFSIDILESMSGGKSISKLLENGRSQDLWHSIGGGRYRFSHSIFRERCYGILMGRALRNLHFKAAQAMEGAGASGFFKGMELARHFEMAGLAGRALPIVQEVAGDAWRKGKMEQASRCFQRLAHLHGSQCPADVLMMWGLALERSGSLKRARDVYVRLIKSAGSGSVARATLRLSRIARQLEGAEEAARLAQAALAEFQARGDSAGVCDALGSLAACHLERGYESAAAEVYRRQLDIADRIGSRIHRGRALGSLAIVLEREGRLKRALECASEGAGILREEQDRQWLGRCLGNVGNLQLRLGEVEAALDSYREWVELAESNGRRRTLCRARSSLGIALSQSGRHEEAAEQFSGVLRLARELGDRVAECRAIGSLGTCLIAQGSRGKAMSALKAACRMARKGNRPSDVAWSLANMGLIHRSEGRLEEGREVLEHAVALLRRQSKSYHLADTLVLLADVHMRLGDHGRARRLLRESISAARHLNQGRALEKARARLARLNSNCSESPNG